MKRLLGMLVLSLAVTTAMAAEGGKEGEGRKGGRRPPPGMIAKFALEHAEQLSLTTEQKTKLEELLAKAKDGPPGDRPPGDRPPGDRPPEKKEHGPEGRKGPPDGGPVFDILTEEQRGKLKELLKAEHPEGRKPPKKDQ